MWYLILVLVFLPIINSVLIVVLYNSIVLTILTLFIILLTGVLLFALNKNYKLLRTQKIVSVFTIIFSIINISIVMLSYSTEFVRFIKKSCQYYTQRDPKNSALLKGKIYILTSPVTVPAANAKLYFVRKDINEDVILYTDIKGMFEYEIKNLTSSITVELKIQHVDCKDYTTEINLVPNMVKDIEIFLDKK